MEGIMRTIIMRLIVAGLLSATAEAQSTDFRFVKRSDAAYAAYVDSMEAMFNVKIDGDNDSTDMWARLGLLMVSVAKVQVAVTDFGQNADGILENVDAQADSLDTLLNSVINLEDSTFVLFVRSLRTHLEDPKYAQIKTMLEDMGDNLETDADSFQTIGRDMGEQVGDAFELFFENLDSLQACSTYFAFTFIGADSQIVTIDTVFIRQVQTMLERIGDMVDRIKQGVDNIDTGLVDTDPAAAIDSFRGAIAYFNEALDTLEALLTAPPLDTLGIKTEFIGTVQDYLEAADSVLAGKEFTVGDSVEGKTIRPVSLLEHPNEDWWDAFLDVYRVAHPESLTFFDLFPNGLTEKMLGYVTADLVLDLNADSAQLDQHFNSLETQYQVVLAADPDNADAHMGMAIILSWRLVNSHKDELEAVIGYLDTADFAGLTQDYTWKTLDYRTETDVIRDHFQKAKADSDLSFVLLMVSGADGVADFTVGPGDELQPVFIVRPMAELISGVVEVLVEVRNNIAHEVERTINDLRSYADIDLDPNQLDFSQVASDLEAVDILIGANSNFLNLTPDGIAELRATGERIRRELARDVEATAELKLLCHTVAMREADLGVKATAWRTFGDDLDSMVNVIKTDFDYPDSTVIIDDERVNLSAWFDNPPDYFIHRVRWTLDEDSLTDNTLGGLFPDRGFGLAVRNVPQLTPYNTLVKKLTPNPARDYFTIGLDLPAAAAVSVALFDVYGIRVKALEEGIRQGGRYVLKYRTADVTPGLYFVRLSINGKDEVRRLILTK
jgi:hypothetical protein